MRGAEDVARRAGYRIILCDTRGDLRIEREVIEEMIAHRVEGIVIAPVSDRSKGHLLRLAKFGVPFVLVDRTVPGIDVDAILGDSVGGAQQLVEHLISLGHRRIGFIVESDEVSTARDRRRGYESALERGRHRARSGARRQGHRRPARGLRGHAAAPRAGRSRPTAVFTVNNLVALGAIEAVREAGLEVPDDVALVCFDDIEYASRLYPVPHRHGATGGDIRDARDAAAARAHRRPRARASRMVVLPAEFVVRKSCGASLRARRA